MINGGKDLGRKPNPRTLSQEVNLGLQQPPIGSRSEPRHPGTDRESQIYFAWQAQQASLNHHILTLPFHLVKLLFTPFIFSAFTTYDIKIYIDLLHIIPISFFAFILPWSNFKG